MFYTYLHIRNDTGQVFYVGKGKGDRAWKLAGRNERWRRTAEKHGCTVEIVARWPFERDAILHEIILIATFRDLGHPLVNLTGGGEGHAGFSPTQSTRTLLSDALRTYLDNDERRRERGDRLRRAWEDPRQRERFISNIKAHHDNHEWSANRAAAIRAGKSTPEYKKRKAGIMKAAWLDPAYRAKICRAVVCVDTGVAYESAKAAAAAMNLSWRTISDLCRGGRSKTAGGYKFRYATATEAECLARERPSQTSLSPSER